MWFACVGNRSLQFTTASTRVPGVERRMSGELDDEHLVVAELEDVDDLEPLLLAVDGEVAPGRSPGRRSAA